MYQVSRLDVSIPWSPTIENGRRPWDIVLQSGDCKDRKWL